MSECIWRFVVLTVLWSSWSATIVPQDWDRCQWALWPCSLRPPPYGTMICKCQPVCYWQAKQVLRKSAACDLTPFRHIRSSPAVPLYPLFRQCISSVWIISSLCHVAMFMALWSSGLTVLLQINQSFLWHNNYCILHFSDFYNVFQSFPWTWHV